MKYGVPQRSLFFIWYLDHIIMITYLLSMIISLFPQISSIVASLFPQISSIAKFILYADDVNIITL